MRHSVSRLRYLQFTESGALHLGSRPVPGYADFLPVSLPVQNVAIDAYMKCTEQHLAYGHFVNDRVEPVDQQQFDIRRLAVDLDGFFWSYGFKISDHGGQRQGCLLKGRRHRGTKAAHTYVGDMGKMFPTGSRPLNCS